jgi:D-serine deaminase-like pyridoxal phosphate-dependent protein
MLSKPTLLLDVDKCKANIKKMAEKARKNNIEFRPHFKTHQSHEIGEWFRAEGVNKITVSSVAMANYFFNSGWKDITIAFPINILEIKDINKIAASVRLNILVESVEILELLEKQLTTDVNVFIKINIGNNRAGIESENIDLISQVASKITETSKLNFKGFLGHAGHSYACRNQEEISEVHKKSIEKMIQLKNLFIEQYPNLIISVGDTPTCTTMDDFSIVDEFRPGVFVFHDSMQLQIGSCNLNEIAIAMACPVVAIHKDKNEIIIYGGSVHFASDRLTDQGETVIFGKVVKNKGAGWGNIIKNVYVKKLSQEHGILKATSEFIENIKIGDIIKIIPVHACTTANLFETYLTLENEKIERFRF